MNYSSKLQTISLILPIVAIIYIGLLPFSPISRPTYLSENALLADYAGSKYEEGVIEEIRHFSHINSDADLKSALRDQCDLVSEKDGVIECIQAHKGGDGTESIVLVAPQHNNHCGTALLLSLMSNFQRSKHWAKDIIYLLPENKNALDKWIQDYHSIYKVRQTGVIQTALVLHIPGQLCLSFHNHELLIEGTDGLLPNLDLVNTIVKMGAFKRIIVNVNGVPVLPRIASILQPMSKYYEQLFKMIWRQSVASQQEYHATFLKYRIDAVTLRADSRRGIDSSMRSTFETIEGTVRSMNNLLEHMHQSFFFYLIPKRDRFVSIANYVAIPALLALSFLINAFIFSNPSEKYDAGAITRTMSVFVLNAAIATFFPNWSILAVVIDLVFRSATNNNNSNHMSIGCILYSMGILLLTMTNISLAIIMGLAAFSLPSNKARRLCLAILSPLNLLLLNKESWNFGVPIMLLYPANLLLSKV